MRNVLALIIVASIIPFCIGCAQESSEANVSSSVEHIIYDALPQGFIVESKEYIINDTIHYLVYLKNTTDIDYKLSITNKSYDQSGKLIGETVDPNVNKFCSGYETFFWLTCESLDPDAVVGKKVYELSVSDFTGEKINLSGKITGLYESKMQIQELVEQGDTTEYPAIIGKIDWEYETNVNLLVEIRIIVFNSSNEIIKSMKISGCYKPSELTKIMTLYTTTDSQMTWPDDFTGELNYVIAINKAIPMNELSANNS